MNTSKQLLLTEGITAIPDCKFEHCGSLKDITIPETVTHIGDKAFAYCWNLGHLALPEGLVSIGKRAFLECLNLTEMILPETLEHIGDSAFENCYSLRKITISGNLASVPENLFKRCERLNTVTYRGITFPTSYRRANIAEIIDMIQKKDFYRSCPNFIKYAIIWEMFEQNPKDRMIQAYLRKNFKKLYHLLIEQKRTELMQKVLSSEQFVTRHNINELIQCAVNHQAFEIQLMLMDYKYRHFDFSDSDETIRKKFKL